MPATQDLNLLLVEDDAVSAAFLREALTALPARVDHAANLAQATRLANDHNYDLWLVDANLPDGQGERWLLSQRRLGRTTTALALTAELFRERLDSLQAAGFSEVLQKPITVAALHAAVRRVFSLYPATPLAHCGEKQPLWDEATALRALGNNPQALIALRNLFLQELPKQHAEIIAALEGGDIAAAKNILHKLKASTAFVGAARLAQAIQNLDADNFSTHAQNTFTFAVTDHLQA